VLIALSVLAQAVKSEYNDSFSVPGTGSTAAQQLLSSTVPAQSGDSDTIVYVGGASATMADFAAAVEAKLAWFLLTIIGLSFLLLAGGPPRSTSARPAPSSRSCRCSSCRSCSASPPTTRSSWSAR
jgi:hypothetical protein